MKNILNVFFTLFFIGVIVWLVASFVNVNMCNEFGSNYQNFSDWNFFSILQGIINR